MVISSHISFSVLCWDQKATKKAPSPRQNFPVCRRSPRRLPLTAEGCAQSGASRHPGIQVLSIPLGQAVLRKNEAFKSSPSSASLLVGILTLHVCEQCARACGKFGWDPGTKPGRLCERGKGLLPGADVLRLASSNRAGRVAEVACLFFSLSSRLEGATVRAFQRKQVQGRGALLAGSSKRCACNRGLRERGLFFYAPQGNGCSAQPSSGRGSCVVAWPELGKSWAGPSASGREFGDEAPGNPKKWIAGTARNDASPREKGAAQPLLDDGVLSSHQVPSRRDSNCAPSSAA